MQSYGNGPNARMRVCALEPLAQKAISLIQLGLVRKICERNYEEMQF